MTTDDQNTTISRSSSGLSTFTGIILVLASFALLYLDYKFLWNGYTWTVFTSGTAFGLLRILGVVVAGFLIYRYLLHGQFHLDTYFIGIIYVWVTVLLVSTHWLTLLHLLYSVAIFFILKPIVPSDKQPAFEKTIFYITLVDFFVYGSLSKLLEFGTFLQLFEIARFVIPLWVYYTITKAQEFTGKKGFSIFFIIIFSLNALLIVDGVYLVNIDAESISQSAINSYTSTLSNKIYSLGKIPGYVAEFVAETMCSIQGNCPDEEEDPTVQVAKSGIKLEILDANGDRAKTVDAGEQIILTIVQKTEVGDHVDYIAAENECVVVNSRDETQEFGCSLRDIDQQKLYRAKGTQNIRATVPPLDPGSYRFIFTTKYTHSAQVDAPLFLVDEEVKKEIVDTQMYLNDLGFVERSPRATAGPVQISILEYDDLIGVPSGESYTPFFIKLENVDNGEILGISELSIGVTKPLDLDPTTACRDFNLMRAVLPWMNSFDQEYNGYSARIDSLLDLNVRDQYTIDCEIKLDPSILQNAPVSQRSVSAYIEYSYQIQAQQEIRVLPPEDEII